ncbi:N-acetyl-beta-hexosaminidase [Bradyrhizobium elkanii]|uniref:hypothetical protein n=1 Tax=Bradyrhizobium elkanii TaxID=29448 RepID=UPI002169B7B3|nr:hypothetical protein [Bradyrhizobium elkanii]MCS3689397.1 N-acetyl-beta-hexosaminidase [Bradyrhizobium elkanii]
MKIDLNKPGELTLENVRTLIASKDDSTHRQIRVSNDGFLYLSDDVGNRNLDGVKFRLETLDPFNGYVGADAAKSDSWVESVYRTVKKNRESGFTGYVDFME